VEVSEVNHYYQDCPMGTLGGDVSCPECSTDEALRGSRRDDLRTARDLIDAAVLSGELVGEALRQACDAAQSLTVALAVLANEQREVER
jgi:hypothetical protein